MGKKEKHFLQIHTIRAGTKVEPQYGGTGGGREYYSMDAIKVKIINVQVLN